MPAGDKPDYNVHAMIKGGDRTRQKVGVAWTQPNGEIQIRLDPFVVLRGSDDLGIRLFKNEPRKEGMLPAQKGSRRRNSILT